MKIGKFSDDLLDLSPFADRLEKFIIVEHRFVPEGLVLAINASFGYGKSTFLNMWKQRMEEQAEECSSKPRVISLNAWESDYLGEPLYSIVDSLVEALTDEEAPPVSEPPAETESVSSTESGKPDSELLKEEDDSKARKIINAAKDIGWFGLAVSGQVVNKVTGIDAIEAGRFVQDKQQERRTATAVNEVVAVDEGITAQPESQTPNENNAFSTFVHRRKAMQRLKEAIADAFGGDKPKAIIFVDELDRCRPDYAIAYLETIKHIFDIKGLVFILAIDREQLECSAKTAFGADLNFDEYLRKFVHRELTLPQIGESGYRRMVDNYVRYYLQIEGVRACFMKLEQARINNIVELLTGLKLTPRQIQEVFRILGHLLEVDPSGQGRLNAGYAIAYLVTIVLHISNHPFGKKLLSRKASAKETADFFLSIANVRVAFWYFLLCYTGNGIDKNETESADFNALVDHIGLAEAVRMDSASAHLQNYMGVWNNWGESPVSNVFEKISIEILELEHFDQY